MTSSMASPIRSSETSRPSLNLAGSSTSKRRDLFRIGCLSLHHEWDICLRERGHCGFGENVFARLEDLAGESAQQKTPRPRLRLLVGKGNHDHRLAPFAKGNLRLSY